MRIKYTVFLLPVVFSMLSSCHSSMLGGGQAEEEFIRTESGLEYKVHEQGSPRNIEMKDAVVFDIQLRAGNEVLRDTWKEGAALNMVLEEIPFKGSLEEGLLLLSEGDSASFHVNADSLYEKSFGMPKPHHMEDGSSVIFDVKIKKVISKEQLEKDREVEDLKVKLDNEEQINTYFRTNKVFDVEKDLSGLYLVRKRKGKGENPKGGQQVAVHYRGRLLNGQIFDSSYEKEEPIVFTLGKGEVIPGWDIGIALLQEGEKATLVIPSYLAYGEGGAGTIIPPDAPLVFEVELVSIYN